MGKNKNTSNTTHVFVDGSGRETSLDPDEGVPNNEGEYTVTKTTVVKKPGGLIEFKHYVIR